MVIILEDICRVLLSISGMLVRWRQCIQSLSLRTPKKKETKLNASIFSNDDISDACNEILNATAIFIPSIHAVHSRSEDCRITAKS